MMPWLWMVLLLCLRPAETSGEEKTEGVLGVLGGSVGFQLKTEEQFTLITWSTNSRNKDFDILTVVSTEITGKLIVLLPAFHGRLNVSEDGKRLQVSRLGEADSGTYKAQVQLLGDKEPLRETFGLKVYSADGISPHRELSGTLIGVTVAALIVAKVSISACVFARWPCCAK